MKNNKILIAVLLLAARAQSDELPFKVPLLENGQLIIGPKDAQGNNNLQQFVVAQVTPLFANVAPFFNQFVTPLLNNLFPNFISPPIIPGLPVVTGPVVSAIGPAGPFAPIVAPPAPIAVGVGPLGTVIGPVAPVIAPVAPVVPAIPAPVVAPIVPVVGGQDTNLAGPVINPVTTINTGPVFPGAAGEGQAFRSGQREFNNGPSSGGVHGPQYIVNNFYTG